MLLVLLVSPTALADWSQRGGDGGRSGELNGGGPAWDSVAMVLVPPGDEDWGLHDDPGHPSAGTLLLVGDELITTTSKSIVAISLSTGSIRTIAELRPLPNVDGSAPAYSIEDWATDGASLYLIDTHGQDLRIIALDGTGEESVRFTESVPNVCWMALRVDLVFACLLGPPADAFGGYTSAMLIVQQRRIDGSLVWSWTRETDPATFQSMLTRFNDPNPAQQWLAGVTLTDEQAIVLTVTLAGLRPSGPEDLGSGEHFWSGWTLDRATGLLSEPPFGTGRSPLVAALPSAVPTTYEPPPLIADASYVVRLDAAPYGVGGPLDPPPSVNITRDGEIVRILPLPADSGSIGKPAMAGERIVVSTTSRLVGLDRSGSLVWEVPLPLAGNELGSPVMDGSTVFMALGGEAGTGSNDVAALWAFDAITGAALWSHELPGAILGMAGGNGTLAVMSNGVEDRRVITVFGSTPASLAVNANVSLDYPEPAQVVEVDLSSTAPGLLGAASRFKADWGDGETTDWQTLPVMSHSYDSVGDFTARFFAGNTAGQISVQAVEFHVGRAPPQTFLQQQLGRENQDRTFFVLGLAITGIVGAIGILRLRRKRGVLARELAALDAAVQESGDDTVRLDRTLDERRYRARSLLLDSKLDEAQHAVLSTRIEELSRTARLDVVEHSLGFLPYKHVLAIREMLRDGRVSTLERSHFLRLLDEDTTLTDDYKARVRAVVEAWARHDAGART